jgi:hypothetical protein
MCVRESEMHPPAKTDPVGHSRIRIRMLGTRVGCQRRGNKKGWVSGSVGIGYCGHRLGRHASGPKNQERGGGQYSQLSDGYPSTHRRQDKLQKEGEKVVRAIADRSQHDTRDERLGGNSGMEETMSQIFLLKSRSPMQLGTEGLRRRRDWGEDLTDGLRVGNVG